MAVHHKGQRVGVFVDVQNLYYSAKYLYGAKVNFKEILKEAVQGRNLIRAIAYVIRADIRDEQNFYSVLDNIGFEVNIKDLQVFYGGAKKGDWDIGIAMDMIELAPKLDTVVLISGDGDFEPLIQHIRKALGCRVEVIAFGRSASSKIKAAADSFFDLDERKEKFLIKRRVMSETGLKPFALAKGYSPVSEHAKVRREKPLPLGRGVSADFSIRGHGGRKNEKANSSSASNAGNSTDWDNFD